MADNILGINELNAKFAQLSDSMVKKVARKMVVSAGYVVRKEAKAIAQSKGLRKTGALIKNIAIKYEPKAPKGTTQYNLGVRHGKYLGNSKKVIKYLKRTKTGRIVTKRQNDPFYWRFLEFGTKHIQAVPFITPALERKQREAINAMEAVLDKELLKGKA